MTTYYVTKEGSDANTGLSSAASWLTIGKALSGIPALGSGDIVFVAPGTYREVVTMGATPPGPANVRVIGDVSGVYTGKAPGPVLWTSYTTSYTVSPTNSACLNLNGKGYIGFENIQFLGSYGGYTRYTTPTGAPAGCVYGPAGSSNISFYLCSFSNNGGNGDLILLMQNNSGVLNFVMDKCTLCNFASGDCLSIITQEGAQNAYMNIYITNSLFYQFNTGANNTGSCIGQHLLTYPANPANLVGGGGEIHQCSLFGGHAGLNVEVGTGTPPTNNWIIDNSVIAGNSYGLYDASPSSGWIVNNYNRISSETSRFNTPAGTGNFPAATRPLMIEYGQAVSQGRKERMFGVPAVDAPTGSMTLAATSLVEDLMLRTRPAGNATVGGHPGALERHDTGIMIATSKSGTSAGSVRLGRNEDQEFQVAVDPVYTTISIWAFNAALYAGPGPQMSIARGEEIGVANATYTFPVPGGVWNQGTLSFTPTKAGIIVVRLRNNAVGGNYSVTFDDFQVLM